MFDSFYRYEIAAKFLLKIMNNCPAKKVFKICIYGIGKQ